MDRRQKRKDELESLLHHIEGPTRIAKAYREACLEFKDGNAQRVVAEPERVALSLREVIDRILDAEFPAAGATKM